MQRHTPDPCKHKHVVSSLAFSSSPACWYLEIRIERGFRVMESSPLLLVPPGGFQPRCICVQHCLWVHFSTLPGADPLAFLRAEMSLFHHICIKYSVMEVRFGSQKEHDGIWQRRDPLFEQREQWWEEPLLGKEKMSCCKSRGHSRWRSTKGWQVFWRLSLAFKLLIHFCLRQISPQASKPI